MQLPFIMNLLMPILCMKISSYYKMTYDKSRWTYYVYDQRKHKFVELQDISQPHSFSELSSKHTTRETFKIILLNITNAPCHLTLSVQTFNRSPHLRAPEFHKTTLDTHAA